MSKKEFGLQLYSVRDTTPDDMAGTLKKIAELGYTSVEPAGFFGHSAQEFNDMLAENGLKLSGTHSSWLELRDNYEETVAFHKAIGNKRYIIPGADLSSQEKIDEFVDFINEFQPKLAAEGIDLQYHNHAHEFCPNEDGSYIHEQLQKRTNMNFEIDIYWVYRSGNDPIKLLKKLKKRVNCIHVKDGTMANDRSCGLGTAPVAKVVAYASKAGIDMVVESEGLKPDGISEVTRCINYLKTL